MGRVMTDAPFPLQTYQRDILAFFALRKDHHDRIVLWNGHLRWKSEMGIPPNPPLVDPVQSIRGHTANILIIDEIATFPLDSSP